MIDRAHDLPITRQAEALNISRGSVYYLPRLVPKADLAIMQRRRPRTTKPEPGHKISTDCIWSSPSPEVGC